jgi:hypothetical protein
MKNKEITRRYAATKSLLMLRTVEKVKKEEDLKDPKIRNPQNKNTTKTVILKRKPQQKIT